MTPAGGAAPLEIRVDHAVATRPEGSVRWSRVSVTGSKQAMWLVPVRPGAALDWTGDRFLDALDAASRPVVMAPAAVPPGCDIRRTPAKVASFTESTAPRRAPRDLVLLGDAISARAHAVSRGYAIDVDGAARLDAAYAAGWVLVALEVSSDVSTFTTPALRVEDAGAGGIVPFALVGSPHAPTRATLHVVSSGLVSLTRSTEANVADLRFDAFGSSWAADREARFASKPAPLWIRESAGGAMLFHPTIIADGGALPSVAEAYFAGLSGGSSCAATARDAATSPRRVGTACAAGALARVSGGAACVATPGEIAPSAFACADLDDLALAMSGRVATDAALTRWSGLVPRGEHGDDAPIAAGGEAPRSPVTRAREATCGPTPTVPVTPPIQTPPAPVAPSFPTKPAPTDDTTTTTVRPVDSCSGSTTTTVSTTDDGYYDDTYYDEGCSGSSTSSSSSGGSSSGSSSGSWGGSDDYDDSSSSDDDWGDADDWDGMSPKAKKKLHLKKGPHASLDGAKKKRGPSPLSRMAILFVAVALPLRRVKKALASKRR